MTTLLVGTKYLGEGESHWIEVREDDNVQMRLEGLHHLYDPISQLLQSCAEGIDAVQVGFCGIGDLNFLQHLPNVTDVYVQTSSVKDISGLRYAAQLERLAIDRPSCRMDVLGELVNLTSIYLDDWRPGAAGVFNLTEIQHASIRRYPYTDLRPMHRWTKLNSLWLAYGGLESLEGIPATITRLELAMLRKLHDIHSIGDCHALELLQIQGCKGLTTIDGLECCRTLRGISIAENKSTIKNLHPIRHLSRLTYLVLTGFTGVSEPDETVLDELQQLETLIISKKLGIPLERLKRMLPNTDIRMVR
jgi:Leucine-rich repeat (LRR) protein